MCYIHAFEVADDRCGDCGRAFCSECVVYAFGAKKPPLCRACAIARAGVRKHAARPPIASKRVIRREARERRRQKRRAPEKVAADAQPAISADLDWEAVDAEAPAPPPAHTPPPPPAPEMPPVTVGAIAPAAMMESHAPVAPEPAAPAMTSIIDELPYAPEDDPELREVRPSFESRLTRRRL
jgi:hypothetical protein